MTDEEYAIQKARVEKFIEEWSEPLGTRWWDMKYVWERTFHEQSPRCAAETHTTWQYIHAQIHWYLPEIKDLDDAEIEKIVVHEHTHVLISEMNHTGDRHAEDRIDHEERVCSALTKAFLWTREFGQKEAPIYQRQGPACGDTPEHSSTNGLLV